MCIWRPGIDIRGLPWPLNHLLFETESLTEHKLNDLTGQWTPRTCLSPSQPHHTRAPALQWQVLRHIYPGVRSHECWGPKFRSPHLHSEHFTDWTTCPAVQHSNISSWHCDQHLMTETHAVEFQKQLQRKTLPILKSVCYFMWIALSSAAWSYSWPEAHKSYTLQMTSELKQARGDSLPA